MRFLEAVRCNKLSYIVVYSYITHTLFIHYSYTSLLASSTISFIFFTMGTIRFLPASVLEPPDSDSGIKVFKTKEKAEAAIKCNCGLIKSYDEGGKNTYYSIPNMGLIALICERDIES